MLIHLNKENSLPWGETTSQGAKPGILWFKIWIYDSKYWWIWSKWSNRDQTYPLPETTAKCINQQVISERWETNKINPTTAPANSLEGVPRLGCWRQNWGGFPDVRRSSLVLWDLGSESSQGRVPERRELHRETTPEICRGTLMGIRTWVWGSYPGKNHQKRKQRLCLC